MSDRYQAATLVSGMTAAGAGATLASDADRDAAAEQLSSALAEGRLTAGEHSRRVEAAYAARTLGQLGELTADLPAPAPGSAGPQPEVIPGEMDRCLLCALMILCPPAGIAWLLAARCRALAAAGSPVTRAAVGTGTPALVRHTGAGAGLASPQPDMLRPGGPGAEDR